ncbi:MAG: hypothetical protein HQL51_10865 [Magnetococcales bacterium]|nr:hypothetical protein [Magnetococcales bacterium]
MKKYGLIGLIGCTVISWMGEGWCGSRDSYKPVEAPPIVAKCYGLFSEKEPVERAYEPVITCLKGEVMAQARIMMRKRTLKKGGFEQKMEDHLAARMRLFEAIHDRRSESEVLENKNLFVQREVARFLSDVLKIMTKVRNTYKIDENTPEMSP